MTLADLPTPTVLIEQPRVLDNIDRMQEAADRRGIRMRPHSKTHKSSVVARWQIDRGAVGICCAKLGEAEVFAAAGFTDIRGLHHRVGRLDHADEPARFDQPEGIANLAFVFFSH